MKRYDVEQYYDGEGKPKGKYDVEPEYDDAFDDSDEDMRHHHEKENYGDKEIEMRTVRERASQERRVSNQEWEEEKARREEEEFLEKQEENLRAMELGNKFGQE